jgi:two-component system cell cycle response regulator DivK
MKSRQVLLVEDFAELREVLTDLLTHEGFVVIEAADGREAVERARASKPDVIVMDLSMPVMDGTQAARVLKSYAATRHIPILAVTGYSRAFAGNEPLFEEILVKPVDPAELAVYVRRAAGWVTRSSCG